MTTLRIRELAEARGLNITTLSRQAQLAYTTTHALWHGTASQFSMKTLERIACALDVCVADLFAGSPDTTVLQPPHLLPFPFDAERPPLPGASDGV